MNYVQKVHGAADIKNFSDNELSSMKSDNQRKIEEFQRTLSALRTQLIQEQEKEGGNPETILAQLDEIEGRLRTVKEIMSKIELQLKINEAKEALSQNSSAAKVATLKAEIATLISNELLKQSSAVDDDLTTKILDEVKNMILSDSYAGSDPPPNEDSSDFKDDTYVGIGIGTGPGNIGSGTDSIVDSSDLAGTFDGNDGNDGSNVENDTSYVSGSGNIVTGPDVYADGKISRDQAKIPNNIKPVVTEKDPIQNKPSPPIKESGTANITSDPIIKSNDNAAPISPTNTRSLSPVAPIVASGNVDSENTAVENSKYEIEFFNSSESQTQPVAKAKSASSENFAQKKTSSQKFSKTQLPVKNESASKSKTNSKNRLNNGLKNEITDLQNEINNLKTANSEMKTKQLEEQLERALANNPNTENQINRNFATATPGKAGMTSSGRAPASAPIGEGGSSGSFAGGGESVRAPSSDGEKLERSVLKDGQIDISSIGTRFVKDLDDKEAKDMGPCQLWLRINLMKSIF